jgi:hypothetical protein
MNSVGGLRQNMGFTEHRRIEWTDFSDVLKIPENIIVARNADVPNWVADTTSQIGEWRAKARDVYLRWAITINAMYESAEAWQGKSAEKALHTSTIRPGKNGAPEKVTLAIWQSKVAAENYKKAAPVLSANGFVDIFGLLEEVIFEWLVILLDDDPILILQGSNFRDLRKLLAKRDENETSMAKWQEAWSIRLAEWRRKRAYDGLNKVFLCYFEWSKLKRPKHYQKTDIKDWAKTIECIAAIRNSLVHGDAKVSEKVATLCVESVGNVLDFKKDEALVIKLQHLMYFEMFFDQLLSALNLSLIEAHEAFLKKMR